MKDIEYIEALRTKKITDDFNSKTAWLFDRLREQAVLQAPADSYELAVRLDDPSEGLLARVRSMFRDEGVQATLSCAGGVVHATLRALPEPSTEVVSVQYFWSRAPGKFVNKKTGAAVNLASSLSIGPGTVREWYETLVETIIDVRNELKKSKPDASECRLFVGPDVLTILECCVLYRPSLNVDGAPTRRVGSLSGMFNVYKDVALTSNVKVSLDGDDERLTGVVTVLDMNII